MDQSLNRKMKAGTLAFALVMMMTACSSSQVEDGASSAESVTDVQALGEASTDAVPATDPAGPIAEDPSLAQQPAPESLASSGDEPPMGDPSAAGDAPPGDPAMAANDPAIVTPLVEDAPPGDPNLASDPNMADPGISTAPAPENDSNAIASSDLSIDPAPMTESGSRDYLAEADPTPKKKKKKSKKTASASRVARHSPRARSVPSGDSSNYVVKRGDTLMKIAFENYGDLYRWREIYEANRDRIQDPNNVPPGTQLVLNGAGMVQIERNGEQYLIHRGETLGSISRNVYGSPRKWKKLWENNRQLIQDPNKIYAGFYLYYQPEGKLTNEPAAVEGGDSAANRSFQQVNPVAQNPATGHQRAAQVLQQQQPTAPQMAKQTTQAIQQPAAMQNNPPVQQMPRSPASAAPNGQ